MNPRTSKTHPIRVDWLPEGLAQMPGRFGMTFAPGKRASSAFGSPWDRDLSRDLDRLVTHYRADVLVTLLERAELTSLGIEHLFDAAKDHGLDTYWWEWVDGTAPVDDDAMETMVENLLNRVQDGERVVVHCRGGLGRTGTLVGCALRALGFSADEVFEIVRSAREGAIENRAQERFVANYARVRAASASSSG